MHFPVHSLQAWTSAEYHDTPQMDSCMETSGRMDFKSLEYFGIVLQSDDHIQDDLSNVKHEVKDLTRKRKSSS